MLELELEVELWRPEAWLWHATARPPHPSVLAAAQLLEVGCPNPNPNPNPSPNPKPAHSSLKLAAVFGTCLSKRPIVICARDTGTSGVAGGHLGTATARGQRVPSRPHETRASREWLARSGTAVLGVARPQPAREIVGGAHPPTRLATDANVEVDLGLWAWQLTRVRERGERQQTQRTEHALGESSRARGTDSAARTLRGERLRTCFAITVVESSISPLYYE